MDSLLQKFKLDFPIHTIHNHESIWIKSQKKSKVLIQLQGTSSFFFFLFVAI